MGLPGVITFINGLVIRYLGVTDPYEWITPQKNMCSDDKISPQKAWEFHGLHITSKIEPVLGGSSQDL